MTTAATEQPGPGTPHHYELYDQYEVVAFSGWRLAHASTEPDSRTPRWTEISIYKTTGGQYVVHTVGRSLVFHRHGGPCQRGVRTEYDELPDGAVGCRRCWDSDDVEELAEQQGTGQRPDVDLELDRFTVKIVDATGVPPALEDRRPGRQAAVSGVGQRALDQAADQDDELFAAITRVRQVE